MKSAIKILYGELILFITVIFILVVKGPDVFFKVIKYCLFFIRLIFGV